VNVHLLMIAYLYLSPVRHL